MRFGRVEGIVAPVDVDGRTMLHLTVFLESGSRLDVVRDETVAPLRPLIGIDDLIWHADQFTQETIGNELAVAGWEAIGEGALPAPEAGALARSAAYAVRNLG